jgi:hypothetical protein
LKNDDRKETNKEHAVGMFLIGELGEIWVSWAHLGIGGAKQKQSIIALRCGVPYT